MTTEYHSAVTSAEIEDTGRYLVMDPLNKEYIVASSHALKT